MLSKIKILSLVCCLLLVVSSAWATTGSIRGVVSDPEGKPVPGAQVTITSEALIGQTRTAYSNELGVFRFPSVPIGTYSVDVTMEGFDPVRIDNVDVRLDATANVPVSIKLSTVAEALTVVGETPVLDVTQASVATSFKGEMLEELPTQRNMYDLMQVSPGMTVDVGDGQSDRVVAFGSNRQSNSWNVDGVDVSAPETGSAWWTVNPDLIDEVQVLGVGAPAEYGNHTGAVLNVVTKKGGNSLHGSTNYFFQTDGLTAANVKLPDSPFTFHRDHYRNFTAQAGGPIIKDKTWFFGSFEYWRDASTEPGNDPAYTPVNKSDKYDVKVTSRIGEKHEINGFWHHENWDYPYSPTPSYLEPSALTGERGKNPAWGAGWTSTISDNTLLELNYAGWWSDDIHDSQTGSFDDPFIDFTPPGGGITYSGGVWYPWDYVTWKNQFKAKVTHYADNFLNSQHEFKFGVQYAKGSAETNVGVGPNGFYTYNYTYYGYNYLYRAYQDPYTYGGISNDLGFFLDDTVTVNDHLTLNLGVRFDHNTGGIPDYPRLTIGEPSISPSGNFAETGETIPGVDNLVNWNLVSPRIGMVIQPRADGRTKIQGSFGVYYDHNVIGNWDAPAPGLPTFTVYGQNPVTGAFDQFSYEITSEDVAFDDDLKAPRTLQYSAGFDHQINDSVAFGVQYIHKDTKDLVGWEILGGVWEQVPFVDPFTGAQYTLLSQVEVPTLRKGNQPGDFPGGENLRYEQTYDGVVFTFDKRFSDRWGFSASYTWSRSEGLIPRMLSQTQFNPFYGSKEGSDPNNYINADQRLQGDRPHMFRVQAVFQRLPWDLQLSTNMEFSTGRAHNRQILATGLGQNTATVIMAPGGAFRFSPIQNIDLSIQKRFYVGNDMSIRLEGLIYNLLNSDQELFYSTLRLQDPSEDFTADTWTKPRRLQVRVGFQF